MVKVLFKYNDRCVNLQGISFDLLVIFVMAYNSQIHAQTFMSRKGISLWTCDVLIFFGDVCPSVTVSHIEL